MRCVMADLKERTANMAEGTHVCLFVAFAQLKDEKAPLGCPSTAV